jgi:hypothetical protein
MFFRSGLPGILALALLITGCASKPPPTLTPIGVAMPDDVSFDGRWRLREEGRPDFAQSRQAMTGGLSGIAAPEQTTKPRKKKSRRSKGESSVHVFLETGRDLKITQTSDGLFISFDRSVVEEYRFREHRQINVGPLEADRASGWVDGRYVVNTLDRQGALLTETWALSDDDRQLVRTASIVFQEKEILSFEQWFDRVE